MPSHDSGLPCPRCGEARRLQQVLVDGLTVDACEACAGLWLDAGELEELASEERSRVAAARGGGEAAPPPTDVRYLRCPRCSRHMSRRNHGRVSGVIVDACAAHGTWLDSGELEAIRRFVAGGGAALTASAERDAEALRDRARREHASLMSVLRGARLGSLDDLL